MSTGYHISYLKVLEAQGQQSGGYFLLDVIEVHCLMLRDCIKASGS